MDTFEVYTIGNAYFLEKIFNAIRMIFSSGLTGVLKITVVISLGLLAARATLTSDFKGIAKWMAGVIVLTGFFLTAKAKIVIHDSLPDSHGRIQAAHIVEDVPWGLAWIAHSTSSVGKVMMSKFETAFAGVTNNPTYRKYGILFGSKIVEDASRIRISNADLRSNMLKFYRQCMVPDLKMGHTRKNGYTLKDLSSTEDIGEFLKNHASNARTIFLAGSIIKQEKKPGFLGSLGATTESKSTIDGYVSCNKAAHYIYDMIEYEVESNKHKISASFVSQFMGDNVPVQAKNKFFDAVLTDTYGAFLKSSRDASEILKQNVMINSISDSAKSVSNSYARTATDEMTRSSMYSVSQVFQKFIPVIRSVFECLFYGVAPLVIILMVTPIGLEVLKNYAFSFLYLQMWPPMYAILYTITESWTRFSSSGLKHNMESLPQIEAINYDISMVSGYMLALIPVLSMFITKGLVASVGNMATSMMYIPQTAAVNASDQAVKGNYSIGNANLDNHSYDNVNAHKHDDNHSWMSGQQRWQTQFGSTVTETAAGNSIVNQGESTQNLGRVKIGWNKQIGSSFNQSESHAQRDMESASKDYTENLSSGMSKVLGYDSNYSKGTSSFDAINKSMTVEQRESADYARGITDKIAKNSGISSADALKMAAGVKGGAKFASVDIAGSTESQKTEAWLQTQEAMKDEKFSKSLGIVESFGKTSNVRVDDGTTESAINSMKSDFNQASSASSRVSQAQESLHSIQEARSNYESNSQTINTSYDQEFGNWAMKRYGAEGIAKRTETAMGSKGLAQEFLRDKGYGGTRVEISSALQKQDLSLTNADHKAFEDRNKNNQATINEESGGFIAQSQDNRENLSHKYANYKADFVGHSNKKKQELAGNRQRTEEAAMNREREGEKKVKNTATGHAVRRVVNQAKKNMKKAWMRDE